MKVRYIRISTNSQSEERQLARLNKDEKIYMDVISGAVPFNERKQAKALIQDIEKLNISSVSVSSVDRLGRNAFDIQKTINFFYVKNINIIIDNLGIQSIINGRHNPIFKMITDVLANVSQMEKDCIRERQLEGIAIAKSKGIYKGREKGSKESEKQVIRKYPEVVKIIKRKKNYSLREIASITGVSNNTVSKIKKILENHENKEN